MTCTRVSDESLIDLLFEDGPAADRAHVSGCPECAARLREVEASLAQARSADLPEPSPFYWAALRRSVSRRVHQVRGRRWPPLVAAAAALVVAIGIVSGRPASRSVEPTLPAWVALPPAGEDAGFRGECRSLGIRRRWESPGCWTKGTWGPWEEGAAWMERRT